MIDALERAGSMLVVVAHPDDESFGCGSLIATAVGYGCRVEVCCASLGEAGELAPGLHIAGRSVAQIRCAELRRAADRLGVAQVHRLGLLDSGWEGEPPAGSICGVDPAELTARIGEVIEQLSPDLVVTLAGDDGHRDHVRVRDAVTAAVSDRRGTRLYLWCLPNQLMIRWALEMSRLRPDTAHLAQEISTLGTPPSDITDILDTSAVLETRRAAMAAHASQVSPYEGLSEELAKEFLTHDHLCRVY